MRTLTGAASKPLRGRVSNAKLVGTSSTTRLDDNNAVIVTVVATVVVPTGTRTRTAPALGHTWHHREG